jgi:RHS repeat-associated protein
MSFNKTCKRFISILLSLVLLLGTFPISALSLADIGFEDTEKYGIVPEFLQTDSAQLASVGKYLKLYEKDSNRKLAEGEYGSQPELFAPIIPDGREWILEFTQEQTQFSRVEMWSEEGWDEEGKGEDRTYYRGLIAAGDAQGQWGIYDGDQWYDGKTGIGTQEPVANYFEWDGLYWDTDQQAFVWPGQTYGEPLEMGTYAFYIVFQPTHPDNQEYRHAIRVEIEYTEEAILKNMSLREPEGLCMVLDGDEFRVSDPVYMLNGNFMWDYTDFAVYGAQPLEFIRYYNALDTKESEIGYGWRHNYMYSVEISGLSATLSLPNGNSVVYNIKGDGSFVGPVGKDYTLEANGSGYLATYRGQTKYYFDEGGYLTAIEDMGDRRTEIERDGEKINYITNNSGTLYFGYADTSDYLIGDVNMDGVITMEDAIMVLMHCVGLLEAPLSELQLFLADVNGDGVVDTTDAALIMRMIEETSSRSPGGSLDIDEEAARLIIDLISGYAVKKGLTATAGSRNSLSLEDALQLLSSTVNEESYRSITTSNNNSRGGFFKETEKISQISDQPIESGTGRSVSYTYDNGYLLSFTNCEEEPSENTINYSYEDHRITEVSDFNGNTYLTNTYDELGRIASQEMSGQGLSEFEYDFAERVSTVYAPDGAIRKYYYDIKQNIIAVEEDLGDPALYTTYYTYEDGRVTSITDKLGYTTYYNYARPIERRLGDVDGDGKITTEDALLVMQWYVGLIELDEEQLFYADVNKDGVVDMTDVALIMRMAAEEEDSRGGIALDENDTRLIVNAILAFIDPGLVADRRSVIGLEEALQLLASTVPPVSSRGISVPAANGNIYSIEYPDLTAELFEYNELNLLTKATAKDLTERSYVYDALGNLIESTDARGNTSYYTYDSDNNMLTSRDNLDNLTTYTYDSRGNMLTMLDPLNNLTTFEYDDQGRLILQTNADTGTVAYEYSTAGKLVKITDADGKEQNYTVNGNGYNTEVSDWLDLPNTTVTIYNDMNKPVSVTDAENNTTVYEYDDMGQMVLIRDALNYETSYAYDLAGRMTSMTDARNNTWTYEYDAEGRMTAATDPLNNLTSSVYDSMGRVISSINARNATTSYEYDDMGRLVKATDHLNNFSSNKYDENGNLIKQYDKNGNMWSYVYDANNRMIESIDPLNAVALYEYDENGQQTKTVSPGNAQTVSEYDSMGRLVKTTDPEGNETDYTYDLLGRLIRVDYADETYTVNEYNANGWLISSTVQDFAINEDPLVPPKTTSYTYNNNGQVETITDALGGVTGYVYDALGRTVSVTDALGGVTLYDYDENGNLRYVTNVLDSLTSYVTEYQYDELNRVVLTIDPLNNETAVEYDENGNVKKVTNADGGFITYSYDMLDRLTGYTDTEGYTFSFTYDANGNQLSATDGRGNTTSTRYDALNRPDKNTDQLNNYTLTEYDADGHMIRFTNAEQSEEITPLVTEYSYDYNGNVTTIRDLLGNETTLTYDSMNRVATSTDARGAVTRYTYTATGQVETVTDALNGVKSYTYDLLGNLLSETNELGKTTTYTYDALSRPLTVTNPLLKTDTFTYDALGRIKTVSDKKGNLTQYFYDANGNLVETKDALNHSSYFEYDAMNRLVQVTLNRLDARHSVNENQVTIYQYDKRGLVTKEINAANDQTIYVYDGNGNLIQKTDADGYVTEYSYDPRNLVDAINYDTANLAGGKQAQFAYNKNGELIAMMDWNGTVNFALDVLDRIISVNDQNEKITGYTYDAVGNQTGITYPDSTVAGYTYDLLGRLTNLNDAENMDTSYQYDAASQLIFQNYPNSWDESYVYDGAGQLLTQLARDPSDKVNKQILHTYTYDNQGNILNETRSGAGGQDKFDYIHSYDALNRLTQTTGQWGYPTHTYEYDSLGNLLYEKNGNGNNKGNEYEYNNLNQQIRKIVDGKSDDYDNYFDRRGNLVEVRYNGNGSNSNRLEEAYTYDATNRMVKGRKYLGTSTEYEESHYIYNGLGHLVANEWIINKNNYGYHGTGIALDPSGQVGEVVVCDRHTNSTGLGHINPTGKGHTTGGTTGGTVPTINKGKYAVVHKDYVLDFTSPLQNVIMEMETGDSDLTYRYTHGLQKASAVVYGVKNGAGSLLQKYDYPTGPQNIIKLYYHHDRLGTTDYLTDNVKGEVASYLTYDAWGQLTAKAIVQNGVRLLDLVAEYTSYPYDQVLELYYAKARMYDASDRRFVAIDSVKGIAENPATMVQYTYCLNNPLVNIDPTGMWGKKVHKEKTKEWAENAKFNEYEAKTIAAADQYVDNLRSGKTALQDLSWHFDMSYFDEPYGIYGDDTRGVHFRREKENAKKALNSAHSMEATAEGARDEMVKWTLLVLAKVLRQEALESFGTALHPIQDKYAHKWFKPKLKGVLGSLPHVAYFPRFDCDGEETNYVYDAHFGVFDNIRYDLDYKEKRVLTGTEVELMQSGTVDVEMLGELSMVYVVLEGTDRFNDTKNRTDDELKEFYALYKGGQRLYESPN